MSFDWKAHFGGTTIYVSDIQNALNKHGASPALTVDGEWGQHSADAMNAFLTSQNMPANVTAASFTSIDAAARKALGFPQDSVVQSGFPPAKGKGPTPTKSNTVGLKSAVSDNIYSLFGKWEGKGLPYMYTDSKGFVTTGTGNLIDPIASALALPWKNADGSPASQDQITSAWNTVKGAYPGTQSTACASLTTIRLDTAGLNQLFQRTVQSNYATLKKYFPNFDHLPADAQMTLLSYAWAWGAGFTDVWDKYWHPAGTDFKNAIANLDFQKAIEAAATPSSHEELKNAGIIPRDKANVAMLQNAMNIIKAKAGFDQFFYPSIAPATAVGIGIVGILVAIGAGVFAWRYFA